MTDTDPAPLTFGRTSSEWTGLETAPMIIDAPGVQPLLPVTATKVSDGNGGEWAVCHGDILIGEWDYSQELTAAVLGEVAVSGITVQDRARFRWPGGVVPYVLGNNLGDRQRVLDAMRSLERLTANRYRFVERTGQADYLEIVGAQSCASFVGRQGGRQFVWLAPGCGKREAEHELLHAMGLWHTQSREDRDTWCTVHLQNIIPEALHNFDKHVADGEDWGSPPTKVAPGIMIYGSGFFTSNGQPTLTWKDGSWITPADTPNAQELGAALAMLGDAPPPPPPPPPPPSPTREAQRLLNGIGWPALTVDGVAGPRTRAAIAHFQVGYSTWNALGWTSEPFLTPTGTLDDVTFDAIRHCSQMGGKFSPNFRFTEFMDATTGWTLISWITGVGAQRLRDVIGKAMPIVSGYRTWGGFDHPRGLGFDVPRELGILWWQALAAGATSIGIVDDGSGRVSHIGFRLGLNLGGAPPILWFYDPVLRFRNGRWVYVERARVHPLPPTPAPPPPGPGPGPSPEYPKLPWHRWGGDVSNHDRERRPPVDEAAYKAAFPDAFMFVRIGGGEPGGPRLARYGLTPAEAPPVSVLPEDHPTAAGTRGRPVDWWDDQHFAATAAMLTRLEIPWGPYWWLDPSRSLRSQVERFMALCEWHGIDPTDWQLPIGIDAETWPAGVHVRWGSSGSWSPAQATDWLVDGMGMFRTAAYGSGVALADAVIPYLPSHRWAAGRFAYASELAETGIWLPHYGTPTLDGDGMPDSRIIAPSGRPPVQVNLWQYTSTLTRAGWHRPGHGDHNKARSTWRPIRRKGRQ